MKNNTTSSILANLRVLILVGCLTFLQFLVLSPKASAAESTNALRKPKQICADFKNIGVVFINLEREAATCETFKDFDEMIGWLNTYSESPLQLGYLQIDPKTENNYGSEDFEQSKVTLSYDEFGIDWNRASKIVFIHEVGHLILDQALAKEVPILKTQLLLRENQARYAKVLFKIQQLQQADPTCDQTGKKCANQIRQLLTSIRFVPSAPTPFALLQKFRQENRANLAKLNAIRSGYDELYADLVQAVVLNHPAINNQASRLFGIPTESCRTFNEDLPAGFVGGDSQCRLSAVRYQLWNEFVAPNLKNKKWILKRLSKVIAEEIKSQLQSQGRPLTPAEQGDRLIRFLTNSK